MRTRDYSRASHIDKVVKASCARHSTRAILLEICRRSEFKEPTSTFTKDQLQQTTLFCMKTVRMALSELRAEGVLVPVQHFEGGRGNAVTYRLEIVGQGGGGQENGPGGGPKPKFSAAEFSRIHRSDGLDAAMRAKAAYEQE